jgi:hypothetical protein
MENVINDNMREAAGKALLTVGRIRFGGEESEPITWTNYEDFLLPREKRIVEAMLAAVVPLFPNHSNIAELIADALMGVEDRRAIWTDRDYLIAAYAGLTGNGDEARRLALIGDRTTEHVLKLVEIERRRQERLKAEGRFKYTCADPEMTNDESYLVLGEEFGEVARQVLNDPSRTGERSYDGEYAKQDLINELVQVAAVSVAWAERLIDDQT